MLLQLMKRLQIFIWLLLTFNLTLLYSTILSTVTSITPTLAAADNTVTISSTAALATATTTTFKTSSASSSSHTTTSSSAANHNRRLHLHLEHHQYTQQQYPASYQNYPLTPHIATEFMDEFYSPNQADD
ncbi:hypothetical protein FF38_08067 [Lucilia cuprina]|uniref:Uncharacterized protein n=1 Tax=Lucilia cuprina TaxID=7375 RepID=A0A0L0BS11_LUCCU|nr:hypothetical protein FF38_08067 [Lucilia cuprina]